jgi:hypothetical protein
MPNMNGVQQKMRDMLSPQGERGHILPPHFSTPFFHSHSTPILPSSHNPLPSRPSRERVPEERGRVRRLDTNDGKVAYL